MNSIPLLTMNTSSFTRHAFRAQRALGRNLTRGARAAALLFLIALVPGTSQSAAPPAGTSIGNQASATYTDSSNTPRTATSNVAITIVQQVASFVLTTDGQSRFAAPGGQVAFPHTLLNTGNGTDTFPLSVVNDAGDDYDLTSLTLYADANGDGLPDNATPITTTGPLPSGVSFQFVAVGIVPGTVAAGDVATFRVLANGTATATPAPQQANTDTVTVTADAVVNVTKAISANSGPPGSGPYTITLTYLNVGNNTATNVQLRDVIPAGMVYVGGSGRWSITGPGTALTDVTGDTQGTAPDTIAYDFDGTVAGRVTAIISRVQPGQSGTVTFEVTIDPNAPAGVIFNTVTYLYDPGTGASTPVITGNTVQFTVVTSAGVTMTGQTIPTAPQGSVVAFTNVVQNTGNAPDTFDITFANVSFPAGTAFTLYQSDGNTPLVDSTGNGIPDTGPLAVGQTYNVIIRAALPPGASGVNVNYTVRKTATSRNDPAVSATADDVLVTVTTGGVDLRNSDGSGAGAGPEAAAQVSNNANPGTVTTFTLVVQNLGAAADSFDLAASTDVSFGSLTLPAGWTVGFRNAGGAIITSTGVLPGGGSVQVFADVTIPAGAPPSTTSLYFRALSPTSSLSDRLHNAVVVNPVRSLSLAPNNTGQVAPGGTITYSHLLVNNGNVLEGDGINSTVSLTIANSQASWSAVVYHDANNNGVIDAGDPVVTDLTFVSNGGAGLDPGETVRLLVQVASPPGAPLGMVNIDTLTATTANVGLTTPVPAVVSATDITTVVTSDLTLVKEQALDAANDGTPDGAFGTADITTGAVPGAAIRYRITVTNTGTSPATQVRVFDTTPAFTTYTTAGGAAPAATSPGSVVTVPANGAAGAFEFDIGTLAPGASAVITFGVLIDQ
jgi:uncharacterized repeat protein (TIGR01451 family)